MNKLLMFFSLFLVLFFTQSAFATATNSPVGLWKTIDDVTNKPKAIVQISESSSKALSGRILKIYPRPGYDQNELCTSCEGKWHNKRIVGMTILENLRQDKNNPLHWTDGEILDPMNGKTYHATVQLIDNGQRLNVRGYVGLPLFGRTQTWVRVANPE